MCIFIITGTAIGSVLPLLDPPILSSLCKQIYVTLTVIATAIDRTDLGYLRWTLPPGSPSLVSSGRTTTLGDLLNRWPVQRFWFVTVTPLLTESLTTGHVFEQISSAEFILRITWCNVNICLERSLVFHGTCRWPIHFCCTDVPSMLFYGCTVFEESLTNDGITQRHVPWMSLYHSCTVAERMLCIGNYLNQ